MRLFVGVGVSGRARASLIAALAAVRARHPDDLDLSRVAWTRPGGWHVTLAFLGEVEDDRLDDVTRVVGEVMVGGPLELGVGADVGAGTAEVFGRSAVALTVRDRPEGTLRRLGASLQAALAATGLPVEQRPVRPHLTIARVRRGGDARGLARAITAPDVSWDVSAVDVIASIRGDGPAVYEVCSSVPLS